MTPAEIPIRWRDFDALGHVNTSVYFTFLEEGRDRWLQRVLGPTFGGNQYVVVRTEVDFQREIPLGTDYVLATHGVARVGRTSITIRERITDDAERAFAEATTVIVLWDPERRTARLVSDSERSALTSTSAAA